jgi:hypothetical protein
MVKLSAQQRNHIMCTAQRLRMSSQDTFFRCVDRILSTCPQPISLNDTLRACDLALEIIPTSDVLVSRSMGPTNDDADYYEQTARRY